MMWAPPWEVDAVAVASDASRTFALTVSVDEVLSDRLRAAAASEREVVLRRAEELTRQASRLRCLLEGVESELGGAARLLGQLEEMLGIARQMPIIDPEGILRGQRIRAVAIQVLKRHRRDGDAVHYREWYELVVCDGHRVGGKDPIATFLAEISRAPEVERVGRRSGLYRLAAA
jgi:hypothetical protein